MDNVLVNIACFLRFAARLVGGWMDIRSGPDLLVPFIKMSKKDCTKKIINTNTELYNAFIKYSHPSMPLTTLGYFPHILLCYSLNLKSIDILFHWPTHNTP